MELAASFGANQEQEPVAASSQIARLISAVFRYKWLVLAISILGVVGSVAATRFVKPSYRVSGTIFIESATKGGRGGAIRPDDLLEDDAWVQLIRSYAVLDSVVLKTRRYLTRPPEDSVAFAEFDLGERFARGRFDLKIDDAGRRYSLTSSQGFVVDTGLVGDSIGTELGFKWAPSASALGKGRDITFSVRAPRDASNDLQEVLGVSLPVQNGVFMRVSLTGTDPVISRIAPDTWLFQSALHDAADLLAAVRKDCGRRTFVVIDLSDAYVTIMVEGEQSTAVLARGCGLDLSMSSFNTSSCARTQFAQMPVVIRRASFERFECIVDRSYAQYLYDWLQDVANGLTAA